MLGAPVPCTQKAVGVRAWINGQCMGIGQSSDRPFPVFDELIHFVNNTIHHSHKIYTFANTFYCSVCGSNVNVNMKKHKQSMLENRY